ncbi:glycosyltransferase [Alkalicoccus urumqiensis]|nr:glycosyltransferase [Alkalicoccus urumqiensis]
MTAVLIIILTGLLIWTFINTRIVSDLAPSNREQSSAPYSLLIPMRNEEKNVDRLLASVQKLSSPPMEIIVLDDHSEDTTYEKLCVWQEKLPLQIIKGRTLPDGWVGKVHACHQLAAAADGDYYLFIDADVELHPHAAGAALASMRDSDGLVTGFPKVPASSFLGKLIIPMQHFLVYAFLPAAAANYSTWPPASAAHGAFMLFTREAYEKTGGHESVKQSLVEDIHLAKAVKKNGFGVHLVNPAPLVTCYMYDTNREVWNGFVKNFFPGLGRSYIAAVLYIAAFTILFILPLPLAAAGLFTGEYLAVVPLLLSVMIKWLSDRKSRQPWWTALLFPAAAAASIAVLIRSAQTQLSGKRFHWKGRSYS